MRIIVYILLFSFSLCQSQVRLKVSEFQGTFANEIKALDANTFYEIYVDKDIDLSVVSPQEIFIKENVKFIVGYGMKIITPSVPPPINGNVKENYVQIYFSSKFIADSNLQIFRGDGLVWFCGNSVNEIYASWWGIKPRNKTSATSNVKAIQQAVNSVTLNRNRTRGLATTNIKLPPSDIYLDNPVVAFSCDIDAYPFLTGRRNDKPVYSTIINIEGAETIKHESNFGNTTNIIYSANWGAPFMLQGLRNSSIRNIRFQGQNKIDSKDDVMLAGYSGNPTLKNFIRPDDFNSYDLSKIGWISDNIDWGKHRPYSAIITDPFNDVNGGFRNTSVDLYYGIETHQNSWSVVLENQHCNGFVSWMVNTLTGQQGDTFQYNNIMVMNQPFGVSTCQDQSRDCKATNFMAYVNVWSAFEGFVHGDGHGVCPEIQSFHSAGGLKYIVAGHDNRRGMISISNAYTELMFAVGRDATTDEKLSGTGTNFTGSINNSTVKYADTFSYTISGKTAYLPQRPTIENFGIMNTHIGIYGYENISKTQGQFRNCTILNCAINGDDAPIDASWWLGSSVSSSNSVINTGVAPNKKSIGINFDNENTGRTSGKLSVNTSVKDNGNDVSYLTRSYPYEETFDLRRLVFDSIIVDKDNDCVKLRGKDIRLLNDGELVFLYGNSKNDIGTVVKKTTTEVTIANLKKSSVNAWKTLSVVKRYVTKSHLPFTFTAKGKEITVVYKNNPLIAAMPILKDMALKLPDGKIYYVEKVLGNVITIDREYKGEIEKVMPLYPNFEIKN